jgi:hypothetical protein
MLMNPSVIDLIITSEINVTHLSDDMNELILIDCELKEAFHFDGIIREHFLLLRELSTILMYILELKRYEIFFWIYASSI